jgi:hypothetical protein
VSDDQDQLDRIAEKRVTEEAWRTQKPTQNVQAVEPLGETAPIDPLIAGILNTVFAPQRTTTKDIQ